MKTNGLSLLGLATLVSALTASPALAADVYFGEDLTAGSAAALTNSVQARSSFVSALAGYGTESFETFAGGQVLPVGAGLTFTGSSTTAVISGGLIRNVPFNARFAADGTNYYETDGNRRITFSAPVAAFGLFVIDANENNNNPATVTVNGQLLTQAQINERPFDSVDGIFRIVTERAPGQFEVLFDAGSFPAGDSSGMFVGLIDSANPFSNIILINGTSGLDGPFLDGFAYDGIMVGTVQMAAIPEPETYALMLGGLGLLGLAVRRRNAVQV
ncbi:MAG: PEP-CTERM sorting domain-containing protein [Pseudomonadota bacterium]